MSRDHLLDAITSSFIASAERNHFSGVVASSMLQIDEKAESLREALSSLVIAGEITAVFRRMSMNIHIKLFPDLPISEQQELLQSEDLGAFTLYPTEIAVRKRANFSGWHDRPFSKALLLAEPQLRFRAFDMGVLDRYVADPRYVVHFNDYMGDMVVADQFYRDDQHPERDKVLLDSFGLGFDAQRTPYLVVYLRYLSGLSPEHQQYWNSFLTSCDVKMCKQYHMSSIEGEFWDNRSARYAISQEMKLIRQLSEAIWGQSLFRPLDGNDIPIGLTSFLRPTAENFNRFVMALDKIISESIDYSFFENRCTLDSEKKRPDGKIVVTRKGTLSLLEEWLLNEIIWEDTDAFREVIIKPLRQVRRLRQTPAHTFTADTFSMSYYKERKRIMWSVLNSLSNIRATFAQHPRACNVEIPSWLDEERIDVF